MYDVTTALFQIADMNILLSEKSNLLFMFCEAPNSTRFIIQDSNSIQLFSIMIPKIAKKKQEEEKRTFLKMPTNRNII
jgi:hypothetical protein